MLKSKDVNTINLARQLIMNEPLLDIIVGDETRTLHDLVKHCKPKFNPFIYPKRWVFNPIFYDKYKVIVENIELALESGIYKMYD